MAYDASRAPAAAANAPAEMSLLDSLAFAAMVVLPTIAKGVLIRRPLAVKLAAALDLDRRAVRHMQRLRASYGEAPLFIRNPLRRQFVVLLAADDVRAVLEGAPDPFTPASDEKQSALSHFEPHMALVTRGAERAERRAFSDEVLQSQAPMHALAGRFASVAAEQCRGLVAQAKTQDALCWPDFIAAWMTLVRRVVLGDAARDDHGVTDLLGRLRGNGNWAFMRRRDTALRARLHRRLADYLAAAEPGSLAALAAAARKSEAAAPSHQMAQWLFAFDAGGIASFRTLALLASHPAAMARVREEIAGAGEAADLPFLRACFIESVRLWPTTPAVLRQATRAAQLGGVALPAETGVLIFAPFFHRDDARLEFADRFAPELWLHRDPGARLPLIPFSAGPAICPGRHLVALVASLMLMCLLKRDVSLPDPPLGPDRPLPGLLDHYALRFRLGAT